MVGITYVYIDIICTFCRYIDFFFFFTHLYCLAGCLSMIVWIHAVLSVLCMCFIVLYLHLFSTVEHVSHGKVLQKYNHYHCYTLV